MSEALSEAERLAEDAFNLRNKLAGKRVRVVRAIVYEGEGATVLDQLARSLPVGSKKVHDGALTITVSQGEIEVIATPPPRIEVKRVDSDSIVGIAPADDGSGGWVVMAVQADPDGPGETIEPLGDDYGAIIYADINDAAEVLKTGIVWKHDMGDGQLDEKLPGGINPVCHRIGGCLGMECCCWTDTCDTPRPTRLCRTHGSPDEAGICDWTADTYGRDVAANINPAMTVLDEDQPDPPGGFDPSDPEGWDDSTGKE